MIVSITETWRTIPRFPGYEISSIGRVRSLDHWRSTGGGGTCLAHGRVLRQHPHVTTKHHYMKVQLSICGEVTCHWVHRLVCEAFHGPPPDPKSMACHKNDIGTDNRAENLEWGSQSYNEKQKYSRRSLA